MTVQPFVRAAFCFKYHNSFFHVCICLVKCASGARAHLQSIPSAAILQTNHKVKW